jgi:uncharacterized protein YjbI with pentapeptide repeats
MKFQIKNRFSGTVIFECEIDEQIETASDSAKMGFVVQAAIKAAADLTGAALAHADLADADLTCTKLAYANLTHANLARADLTGTDLAYATLAYAKLTHADLAYADLAYADLTGTDLTHADLTCTKLTGTDLTAADLTRAKIADANLAYANLTDAYLAYAENVPTDIAPPDPAEAALTQAQRYARRAASFRERFPEVPVIEALDAKILAAVEQGGTLDMAAWHKCETTHCRAGWAITLAGERGAELEQSFGPAGAARRIYLASTGRVPFFYASDEAALADIRAHAK